MTDDLFIVQPYIAKAQRLVAQPARIFADERSARRAGGRMARHRVGVVVMSQRVDPLSGWKERPATIAVYGQVPEAWGVVGKAA